MLADPAANIGNKYLSTQGGIEIKSDPAYDTVFMHKHQSLPISHCKLMLITFVFPNVPSTNDNKLLINTGIH